MDLVLSLIISLFLVFSFHINFCGDIFGNISENTFSDFSFISVIQFILLFLCLYFVFRFSHPFIDKVFHKLSVSCKVNTTCYLKLYFIGLAFMFVVYLVYTLSYLPGGIFHDTFTSMHEAENNLYVSGNPPFFAILIKIFFKISKFLNYDYTFSMILFTMFQMLCLYVAVSLVMLWLLRKRINKVVYIFTFIFFVFFPLIPLYGISVWKDTWFCLCFLLWFVNVLEIWFSIDNSNIKLIYCLSYVVLSLLMCLFRISAIYVLIITSVLLIIKSIKNKYRITLFIIILIVPIVMYYLINSFFVVSVNGGLSKFILYNVVVQQLAYAILNNVYIDDSSMELLSKLFNLDKLFDSFSPCYFDTLIINDCWNQTFCWVNKDRIIEVWSILLQDNPILFLKEFLLNNLGFWDVFYGTHNSYVQTDINTASIYAGQYNITQTDYLDLLFGISLRDILRPTFYFSPAIFCWPYLFIISYLIKKHGCFSAFIFIPQIIVWAEYFFDTFIAFSLRYVSCNMFTLPFILIVPLLFIEFEGVHKLNNKISMT